MEYRHTQFGWVMLAALAGALVVIAGVMHAVPVTAPAPLSIVMLLVALVFLLFISLTVTVDRESVRLSFGIGLIRKSFRLSEIQSVAPVRNHWLYGWGIHLTPRGWLFNVSGLDAVELEMKNGRHYRIGTDEPVKLAEAIRERLNRV